jgi:hypothetical protein
MISRLLISAVAGPERIVPAARTAAAITGLKNVNRWLSIIISSLLTVLEQPNFRIRVAALLPC